MRRMRTATSRQHPRYCFTYKGAPIRCGICNTAWLEAVKRAKLTDHEVDLLAEMVEECKGDYRAVAARFEVHATRF